MNSVFLDLCFTIPEKSRNVKWKMLVTLMLFLMLHILLPQINLLSGHSWCWRYHQQITMKIKKTILLIVQHDLQRSSQVLPPHIVQEQPLLVHVHSLNLHKIGLLSKYVQQKPEIHCICADIVSDVSLFSFGVLPYNMHKQHL